ncbi:hypothetical protein [Microbulbifer rhizosphaerae]|uniref:DUF3379 domain-containing protein n=1 Tax=Microbulbifer rhizosphaerae TaxID=1562603 RepID=A0A7W4Z965_9GAMM|nr:hypothetical protein [Microbulbifer rhizosphaerae]MBB3059905.1 hypothetical protein [Microbulbifer rhizosphaerae]
MTEVSKGRGPLRPQLKQMLERDRLDDRQYAQLQRSLDSRGTRTGQNRRRAWLASAAALLLSFGVWFSWHTVSGVVPGRIAEEVTTNHIHLHPLDIETSSMQRVRSRLQRLDFVPVRPDAANGLTLLGARYCTLQGAIATQLMFLTPDGSLVTFYQAAYDPQRFGDLPQGLQERPLTLVRQGVEIRIWVERGVVMARAQTAAPTPV